MHAVMLKRQKAKPGTVVVLEHVSNALKGNRWGDPHIRKLAVWLPPQYDDGTRRRFPVLYDMTGFTGSGLAHVGWKSFGYNIPERAARLIHEGKMGPAIFVLPDCFTALGGNQYINSSATGRYEDYLLGEIIPFVEKTYSVKAWGVFGKSSGGYGAIVLGMRHPKLFRALADHSGDSNFELCYMSDMTPALDAFREAGGPAKWLDGFWSDANRHRKKYMGPLNARAMAAHYSPNPESPHLGIDFPFDLQTGVFRPDVWERWRAWDPVNMVARHADGLRDVRLIYIDCGTKDEFTLQWGARALATELRKHGLDPQHEEFDDGHMSISYRYDVSLPRLAKALEAL